MCKLKAAGLIMPDMFAVTLNIEQPGKHLHSLACSFFSSLGSKGAHYADRIRPGSSRAG